MVIKYENDALNLLRVEIKYENDASNMHLPSSPFGPSLMSSSRRPSLVSSSNFSATSPLGTTGPTTPQSYGSQMSFEPGMADMCMPGLSFADTSFSTSDSFGYETPDFDSNGYEPQKMSYSWTDSLVSEVTDLNINSHLDPERLRYLHSQEHKYALYPTEYATGHDDIFDSSSNEAFDLHSMMGNTIIPGQMHNNHVYSTPFASAVSTPSKASHGYSGDYIRDRNLVRPFYPQQDYSPSPTNSLARSMSFKNEVKEKSLFSTPRRRAATRSSIKTKKFNVETADGQCFPAGLASKASHRCTWANCDSAFQHKEHLHRHEKKHRGEGMVQCIVCEHSFTRQDNLRQHFEKVHFNIGCHRPRKTRLREKLSDGSIVWKKNLIAQYGLEADMLEFERKMEADAHIQLEKKKKRRASKDEYRQLAGS